MRERRGDPFDYDSARETPGRGHPSRSAAVECGVPPLSLSHSVRIDTRVQTTRAVGAFATEARCRASVQECGARKTCSWCVVRVHFVRLIMCVRGCRQTVHFSVQFCVCARASCIACVRE